MKRCGHFSFGFVVLSACQIVEDSRVLGEHSKASVRYIVFFVLVWLGVGYRGPRLVFGSSVLDRFHSDDSKNGRYSSTR